jgi:CBS domain-containing protein
MLVGHVMAKSATALQPTTTIVAAAKLMAEAKVGILPVVDETGIVGVVTDRDITVRGVAAGLDPETPVSRIMSRDVSVCDESTSVGTVLDQMANEHRRRIPVTSAEGKIVGVVSLADAARAYDDRIKVMAVFNKVFAPGGGQTG